MNLQNHNNKMQENKEIIKLWHGGRNLESSYKDNIPCKGLWEYGPGLYLTTSYERARKYAKGGGSTYAVEVYQGNDIDKIDLPIEKVQDFISENVIGSKKKEMLEDIHSNMKRLNNTKGVQAQTFLNLIINNEAVKKTKTHILNEFLVANSIDYGIVTNYGGSDETVLVVFNRAKIKSVKKTNASDVSLDDYSMPFAFNSINQNKKIGIS